MLAAAGRPTLVFQVHTLPDIHSSAGHFWGRRAGHGIPDLKTPLENYFDLPLRCLACGQRITRGLAPFPSLTGAKQLTLFGIDKGTYEV